MFKIKQTAYLVMGHILLLLGLIGIVVPGLPTTPFLLLTAFCYARGSERYRAWLLNHPRLGPPIIKWQEYGIISRRAKVIAVSLISFNLAIPLFFLDLGIGVKVMATAFAAAIIGFLVSRPEE